ncbi:MAG: GlxA family transcriptional regulator [Alphaproteobacteria bacterium]|nr:GlxA family transcriptional regulator [Alphaproteobacteria bacterium]
MAIEGRTDLGGTGNGRDRPRRVGFFLAPHFSMMAFSSALEPLRVANLISRREVYRWQVFSRDGRPVAASNGIAVPAEGSIRDIPRVAMMFVCASHAPEDTIDRATLSWLRRIPVAGITLGALDTGAWFLAHAGLLDGHRATVHWEWQDAFAEKFPEVDVRNSLFEIDRGRLTCAGGTAALDMMLHLIGLDCGHDVAVEISEQFIHERIRAAEDAQRMPLGRRLGVGEPKLEAVVAAMEGSLEEPLRSAELAAIAGVSERQLERLFRRGLGCTPTGYYLGLRLRRARILLGQTRLPVREVALACGFASPAHFSRAYSARFGSPPREERR